MAVTPDGTPATGSVNGGDSFTITLSTTGPNRLILVGVGNSNGSVTTVTPTASGLTFVQVDSTQTTQTGTAQLYRAFATSQLSSVVITCTASPSGNFPQMTGWAVGFSSTDTSGTNGSGAIDVSAGTSSAGANGLSQAVTTVTDQCLVIGFAEENAVTSITAGSGQTKVIQVNNAGTFNASALLQQNAATTPAGSVTISYTFSGNPFNPTALIVAAIKPAPVTGQHNLTMLGVGK